MQLAFCSEIQASYRPQVEELLFFNERQTGLHDPIVEALALYGPPEIVEQRSGLRIPLRNRDDAQCLFALDQTTPEPELVGVLVYLRRSVRELLIVHIAVASCGLDSPFAGRHVASAMIRTIRKIAQRLRGVEQLSLFYGRGRELLLHKTEEVASPV